MSPLALPDNISQRQHLSIQQFHRCEYCDRLCDPVGPGGWQYGYTLTIEHVVPRSRGGSNTMSNMVGSCFRCNNLRNEIEKWLMGERRGCPDMPLELFLKLLPVDIFHWRLYKPNMLGAVVEQMRWGHAALQA